MKDSDVVKIKTPRVQLLGAFLVAYMHELGLLAAKEKSELLQVSRKYKEK